MRLLKGLGKHSDVRTRRGVTVALVVLAAGSMTGSFGYPQDSSRAAAYQARAASLAAAHAAAVAARSGAPVALRPQHRRGGRAYYRSIARRHVAAAVQAGFEPLYRQAALRFGVSWRLIASIHRQETAFSTAPSTYHGLNAFGCCAGPMQFNVTNGPVSTWKLYRHSFRIGDRPRRYPHRTRSHPSVYDDFDAIMAAGALLQDAGATGGLGAASWSAAYAYYGHDLFGIGYANQVLARALGWELDGFCVNCPVNDTLVAAFDRAYGRDARRRLRGADRRAKHAKHMRKAHRARATKQKGRKSKRRKSPRHSSDREHLPSTPKEPDTTADAPPETTTPSSAPATEPPAQPAAPPPQAEPCTVLSRLLGCGR